MQALMFRGPHDVTVETVDEPGPLADLEVLLRPLNCGICGTDLHEFTSGPIVIPTSPHPLTGASAPQILGHEFSARVVDVGRDVGHVRAGDLVTVMPLITCGRCYYCVRGANHLCTAMACTGLSSAWGGLGSLAVVSARQVVAVPEGMSPVQAALIEPTAVAAYGVDRGNVHPGDTVLVTGAGPIGSLVAMYALVRGARRVVVAETDPARAARASTLGDGIGELLVIDPTSDSGAVGIVDLAGGVGCDVAVECAGNERALNLCIDATRSAGTVVQTALHVRPASISAESVAVKDLTLVGTWCYPVWDFPRLIGLVASGRLPIERIVTSQPSLERAVPEGFERLVEGRSGEVKVLVKVGGET